MKNKLAVYRFIGISPKCETKFTLSGVDINNQLTFNSHICRKAANQIIRLKQILVYMGKMKKILVKSVILSNELLPPCLAL